MANVVNSTMKKFVPSMVDKRVNKIAKKLVPLYVAKGLLLDRQKAQTDIVAWVAAAVRKERENIQSELSIQVTNDVANSIPSHADSFLRNYMSTNILYVHPTKAASSSIKFEKPAPPVAPCRIAVVCTRDHDDHHDDDARPEGVSSAKRKRTSEHGTYSVGESSSEQVMNESNSYGSGTQEQLDEFDAWMDDFGTDDDEVPSKEVSPELLEEISGEV
ncbi:hypothetical protein Tco_0260955, partial [Tanacetum coccineum]